MQEKYTFPIEKTNNRNRIIRYSGNYTRKLNKRLKTIILQISFNQRLFNDVTFIHRSFSKLKRFSSALESIVPLKY